MRWHEITIHTTEEAIEMTANFMHESGAGGVSIEESGTLAKVRDTTYGELYDQPLNDIPEGRAVIKGYFEVGMDAEALKVSLGTAVSSLVDYDIDPGEPVVEVREVDDADWADAWKQYFKPVRITERLTIKPSWEEYTAGPGEIILDLDPGMAFGTGTHATTSLCLKALERRLQTGDEVIDVGTGSGILAIAAAKLGASAILALDLDPVAVTVAEENVRHGGLGDQIQVRRSDLLGVLQGGNGADGGNSTDKANSGNGLNIHLPVRLVVANILAEIILLFVPDVYEALEPGGLYITSGIIERKEPEVTAALMAAGFTILAIDRDQDWVAITAQKGTVRHGIK